MKQRAKVYKGKRVVMGDKNRVTKHEIHVNDIPQEGGESSGGNGGGGGGSASGDWHYFDVSALDSISKTSVLQVGMLYKLQGEKIESFLGAGVIAPIGFSYLISADITTDIRAIAMDFTTKMQIGGQIATVGESITTAPWYGAVPEITEEEFYTL